MASISKLRKSAVIQLNGQCCYSGFHVWLSLTASSRRSGIEQVWQSAANPFAATSEPEPGANSVCDYRAPVR